MKYSLTAIQVASVLLIIVGSAQLVRANSSDGCMLKVFRSWVYIGDPPVLTEEQYMEYRVGYPKCIQVECNPPTNDCKVRTINVGGTTYQYCGCTKAGSGSGCWLGYTGTETTGGTAHCVNRCPTGQNCEEVNWVPSSWDPNIEKAEPCDPCQ
jgi:hypothetical protein